MQAITRTEIVDFRTAPAERKAEAIAHTIALLEQLFEGPGLAPQCEALARGEVGIFSLALYFAGARPVGFAMVVHDVLEIEGREIVVGRGLTGLHREFRGGQRVVGFYLRGAVALLRHHRDKPVWGFVAAAHISSYRVIARNMPGVVPHPDRELDATQRAWIDVLAERFHYERRAGDHPLVCRRPVRVRGARTTPPPTPRPLDALDRFYLGLIPPDAPDACIMTLFRLSFGTLIGVLGRAFVARLRSAARRIVVRGRLASADPRPAKLR